MFGSPESLIESYRLSIYPRFTFSTICIYFTFSTLYMVHQFQSQLDLKVVVLKTKCIFKIGPAMNKIVKQKLSLRTSVVQLCTYTSHFTPLSKMLSLLNCRLSIWSKNVRFTLLNEIHIMN